MSRHRLRNAKKENWMEAHSGEALQFLLQGKQETCVEKTHSANLFL